MIYLVGQLLGWLLLTAAFAAVAGGAFAAERGAPKAHVLRRERDNLVRDILKLATDDAPKNLFENERETDAIRRQLELRDGRIHELEHLLESARARADAAADEAAGLRRRLDEVEADAAQERGRAVAVVAKPVAEAAEDGALQAWRLRYFEQRVRYLESQARSAQLESTPDPAPGADPAIAEWRAREAEARADFLAQELRAQSAAPVRGAVEEEPPFASSADVDALLRWRMLYLERRLAHFQRSAAAAPTGVESREETGPDPDRWKWRARYLEARVRHLEARVALPQQGEPEPESPPARVGEVEAEPAEPAPVSPSPSITPRKPPVLTAPRNGAPDDLTLIEGVSALQRSTLNAIGVYHFDQLAAWTPENVAWVDHYLRLGGRISEENWLEQADMLAREGPSAARRVAEEAL